jgi:putative phosphoribosyl transferase
MTEPRVPMRRTVFRDRLDAGRRLAARLSSLARDDLVVLGLPRGGVPVAYEVATALGVPLDVILVRKVGLPAQPELAMGAIGEDGVRVVNDDVVRYAQVSPSVFGAVETREREELRRRAERFRGARARVSVAGRTALIVDDGIATGSTARAACQVAYAHGAARVIVATPVASASAVARLRREADEVIALESPEDFSAIGEFYEDFGQLTDEEVVGILERAHQTDGAVPGRDDRLAGRDEDTTVRAGGLELAGHLCLPPGSTSLVLFAHGSGSSYRSPRNRFVADVLNGAGLGTLLFDLLTPAEESDRANVFDIALLAGRLVEATSWARRELSGTDLAIGYFGASTGAGAALWAAAEPGSAVNAVVSRGGRPDLAQSRLPEVRAATLLIVGGDDDVVLDLNRRARARMRCETALAVVPHASHLFEEPGTLEQVAELAREWFVRHLTSGSTWTPPA